MSYSLSPRLGPFLPANSTPSASKNSRVIHGSHTAALHASSGDQPRRTTSKKAHPYHEALEAHKAAHTLVDPARILFSSQMVHYLRDVHQTDITVAAFRPCLNGPLGFDIEYRPNFIKGRPLNRTALVQLASGSVTLLVQVSAMSMFPATIKDILEDPTIIKAGVGIKGDADKLRGDFGINMASCLELGNLARAVDKQWATSQKGLISLSRLVKAYEGRELKKPKTIQMSNWELSLTAQQQEYAAGDAISAFNVLQKLYAIMPSIEPVPDKSTYIFWPR